MNTEEILDKATWSGFLNQNNSTSFLQSWEWGMFEESYGHQVMRIGIYQKDELLGIAQIVQIKAKRGHFLFVPHGPVFKFPIKSIIAQFLNFLISEANKNNCAFVRIAPILKDSKENRNIFSDLGFRKAPIYMHAERVWVLDLKKSEEQLLTDMRKTTRYSIRKAERDGVVIEKRTDTKAIDDFYKVYEQTAKREEFVAFSKKFIRDEFEAFYKTNNAIFLFGKVTKPTSTPGVDVGYLASSLILFTKSSAFYHQGASIHTKVPVSYLMQWEAIREAKRRGCRYYNFWGILQPGRSPKNWGGLTMFKQGFGGHQIDYVPTQDYILSPKYYFTYLYEKYLGWRRGV